MNLYNLYRPKTLADVRGQARIVKKLSEAARSGKLDRVHAMLFVGTRGTGKTSAARILAKMVNCLTPIGVDPCGGCKNCRAIDSGWSPEIVEVDAASNRGIDDIRVLKSAMLHMPVMLRRKVFIIDEAHRLSADAKDALLKTLEEPPASTLIILCTTEGDAMPETIRSRCLPMEFREATESDIVDLIEYVCECEGMGFQLSALDQIARHAKGSFRDALSALETVMLEGDRITVESVTATLRVASNEALAEMLELLGRGDSGMCMGMARQLIAAGVDATRLYEDLKDLIVRTTQETAVGAGGAGKQLLELAAFAEECGRKHVNGDGRVKGDSALLQLAVKASKVLRTNQLAFGGVA